MVTKNTKKLERIINGETVNFTKKKKSNTQQFSGAFLQLAQHQFRQNGFEGLSSRIYNLGENTTCLGVSGNFDVDDNGFKLVVGDINVLNNEYDTIKVKDIAKCVIEQLAGVYGIKQVEYKFK